MINLILLIHQLANNRFLMCTKINPLIEIERQIANALEFLQPISTQATQLNTFSAMRLNLAYDVLLPLFQSRKAIPIQSLKKCISVISEKALHAIRQSPKAETNLAAQTVRIMKLFKERFILELSRPGSSCTDLISEGRLLLEYFEGPETLSGKEISRAMDTSLRNEKKTAMLLNSPLS
jgi:hypothetical protein